MILELEKCEYVCGNCGNKFYSYQLFGNKYGEFLLRSSGASNIRYLNTFRDQVFDEVGDLVKRNLSDKKIDRFKEAEMIHAIFGVACDPDIDGTLFQINLEPKCPNCRSSKISDWYVVPNKDAVEYDILPVTHNKWVQLSIFERKRVIDDSIESYLQNRLDALGG